MTQTEQRAPAFELIAGRLCLDFVNTVAWGDGAYVNERLNAYADLVDWARLVGVLSQTTANRLLEDAARRPEAASAALEEGIALRRSIRELLRALTHGQPADAAELRAFNASLSRALGHLSVVASETGFDWGWSGGADELTQMLWPVAWSAATLLTSDELGIVRECAGDTCGWMFLDLSRNRTRRWCDMKGCGNRAKARRHYHRKKEQILGEADAALARPQQR